MAMEKIHGGRDGDEDHPQSPHVAIIPSAGMGHLTPSLRLAATLAAQGCIVSLVSIHHTVSSSESLHISRFFSHSTHVRPLPFHLHYPSSSDPFFLHIEAIRRSAHLLPPLLTSASPPLSALITDVTLASSIASLSLPFPNYICFTSSAAMLSFLAIYPAAAGMTDFNIPGFASPLPRSFIPPLLHNPAHLFTTQFVENGQALVKAHGILVNTFHELEPEPLAALNDGRVVQGLPPVTAVGPLEPREFERGSGTKPSWLDDQPAASVVYVSFGSRTALSGDQIKHLGIGLEKSGCRFLWVVKSKIVDKDDEAVELGELVGLDFLERTKDRGLVVKGWVDQGEVLGHPAVGGFISHCGWNSVTEAAMRGVPVLAWPQLGDQKMNAEIVGWGGEVLVTGEEISRHVQALMTDVGLRARAAHIGEKARQAISTDGSSVKALAGLIKSWSHKSVAAEAAM
ncbi:hypothetical protein ACLOJK_038429 [Asimina triloba]